MHVANQPSHPSVHSREPRRFLQWCFAYDRLEVVSAVKKTISILSAILGVLRDSAVKAPGRHRHQARDTEFAEVRRVILRQASIRRNYNGHHAAIPDRMDFSTASQNVSTSERVVYTFGVTLIPLNSSCPIGVQMIRYFSHRCAPSLP